MPWYIAHLCGDRSSPHTAILTLKTVDDWERAQCAAREWRPGGQECILRTICL